MTSSVAALLQPRKSSQADQVEGASAAPDLTALLDAIRLLREEKLDEADAAFQRIVARDPQQVDALLYLGILRHLQGCSDEGLALIKQSLALAPSEAGSWNNYGNVLLECSRAEEAMAAYRTSIQLAGTDPRAAQALNNLCTVQRLRHEWAPAEDSAHRAIAVEPTYGDAWYNLSLVLIGQNRISEALMANSKAIALWPSHLQARDQVIRALVMLDERGRAVELYRQWLDEEPDNPVVQHQLAACLGQAAPERASDAYVEQVFDAFASSFDAKLEKLGYRAPQIVADALAALLPTPSAQLDIVDLGCGTGLVGPLLRPWAKQLAGCDLSVGMLRRARMRKVYDVLHKAELVHYLQTQADTFDVAVSADTLCYFGALDSTLQAAATALRTGGVLVFTVEALTENSAAQAPTHSLQANGRYAHSQAYVKHALENAGLKLLRVDEVTLRMEACQPVAGWLVAARRPEASLLPATASTSLPASVRRAS